MKREELTIIKPDFIQLADDKTFIRELSFALQLINKNPQLLKCDIDSIKASVLNVAQTGLTLNPTNPMGYLIPSYNGKTKRLECQFRASYQGLVKLITDTGSVNSIVCEPVYEGDNILFDMASDKKVAVHEPYWMAGKEQGKIKAVYSIATLPDGTKHCEQSGIQDIYDKVRERSEAWKYYIKKDKQVSCVWISDEPEMCRKAILRRHTKYLPKTEKWDKLNKAIELDNNDYTLDIDSPTVQYIYSLMDSSHLDDRKRNQLQSEILGGELSQDRAGEIITELKMYQLDPVEAGQNYGTTTDMDQILNRKMADERQ